MTSEGSYQTADEEETMEMEVSQATQVMEEANRIIEDFPTKKYILYALIFSVETALCFMIALNM